MLLSLHQYPYYRYTLSLEPELLELTADGDEEGEKSSTNGAEVAAEGDDLVMERVPSAKSKAADETSSVRDGSQVAEAPQTNPETGEEVAAAPAEGAEGGVAEEGEEPQTTPPLPRTVSLFCPCNVMTLYVDAVLNMCRASRKLLWSVSSPSLF